MRLGLLGGSFDPVHFGHLLLAEHCREQCALDQVLFVPAAVSPHKLNHVPTAGEHRLEMLKLAIAGYEPFAVSNVELKRGGVSYTVDTLEELQREDPTRELFLLMGADSLADLPNWREPARICELATPVVVARAGSAAPDFSCLTGIVSAARLDEIRRRQVVMPIIELSSREIRRRVAEGRSIRFQTPRAVEKYIETHGLYR
jgi:nicotinate-nucleotide adenylyltransferase